MKNWIVTVATLLLITLLIIPANTYSQEKKNEEDLKKEHMEKEFKARQEMLEQQREEMEQQREEMEKQREKLEQMNQERVREFERQARSSARVFSFPDEPEWRVVPDGNAFFLSTGDQGSQTQLTLRNSFRGGSDSSRGDFDVDASVSNIRCMINGKVRSGEIYIKVEYPDGKEFKEMTINSSAEITFSQSLSIKEEARDQYLGSWKYEVKAEKAEGSYLLQIQTR